jgi:hypothetical protein
MPMLPRVLLAVSVSAIALLPRVMTAADSTGGLLCEWREDDLFQDDYAHSSHCDTAPTSGGDDWVVVSWGHWTNTHSTWVFTTIAAEPGDQHSRMVD